MSNIFGLILFYPIISFLIIRYYVGETGPFFAQIKSEYYLWIGCSLLYFGAFILLFSGTSIILSAWISFLLYSFVYFLVSIGRKVWFTDTKELLFKKEVSTR